LKVLVVKQPMLSSAASMLVMN